LAVKPSKPTRSRSLRPEPPRPPGRKTSRPPTRVSQPPASSARATHVKHAPDASQPEITLRRGPVGRETLAAIAEELAQDAATAIRPKLDTIGYEERPKHRSSSRPPQGSSPELISIGEAPIGRATQAAIEDALVAETLATTSMAEASKPQARPLAAPAPAVVYEISTFIVEGEEIFTKVSEQSRRDFVEQRLMHRLPALSMDEVTRIDVSRGAAPNTVILRVWSKVGRPPK
jgi:hypothetical protein